MVHSSKSKDQSLAFVDKHWCHHVYKQAAICWWNIQNTKADSLHVKPRYILCLHKNAILAVYEVFILWRCQFCSQKMYSVFQLKSLSSTRVYVLRAILKLFLFVLWCLGQIYKSMIIINFYITYIYIQNISFGDWNLSVVTIALICFLAKEFKRGKWVSFWPLC